MKRMVAIAAALMLGVLGAASPAFADTAADQVDCYKLAGDGYTQVICQDADGNRVSETTYFDDGCVTTVNADGESRTCPDDELQIEPWGEFWTSGLYPNDIACDVEELTDSDGSAYRFVTCRDTDGNVVSQARYTDDGCVTEFDADGNEYTYCPTVDPWLPPAPEYTCDSEPWYDENGAEYKLVTCVDAEGTVISKVRYAQDGCVTEFDPDGNEYTNCPTVDPWLPPVDSVSCDSEPWFDDNGVGYKLVTCTDAEGNVISKIRYSHDGCATEIDADGNEVTNCPSVEPWLPPMPEYTCDSEPWYDDNGAEYKLVTCVDAAGTVISKVRYAQDGCVTEFDADGNEYTYCKDDVGCSWVPDADGNAVRMCPGPNYADLYYSLPEGTTVTSVTVGEDGCRLITLSDESTLTACPDPDAPESAMPVTLDERGCIVYAGDDGVVWGTDCPGACYFSTASDDGSGNEMATCYGGNTPDNMDQRTLSVCDVAQLLVDGKILALATCDDGCTLVNGVASGSCTDGWLYSWSIGPRAALWVSAARTWEQTCWQREPGGDWASVECPKVMYDKCPTDDDGRVYKLGTLTDEQAGYNLGNGINRVYFASQASTGGDVPSDSVTAEASATQRSVENDRSGAAAIAPALIAAPASGNSATTIAALPVATTTSSTPMSPAVAAMALGVVGVAGAASVGVRRVRVPIRRR